MTAIIAFAFKYWQALAGAAFVATIALWYNVHVDELLAAREKQVNDVRDVREAKAIAASQAAAKVKEATQEEKFSALQTDYNALETKYGETDAARLAAVHAGSRLRIASGCTGAANVPGPAASAAGSPSPATAQFLSESDSAFLIGEAARADKVVDELTLCQSTLNSERK